MERYRIHEDVSVYFVTFSVVEWLPIFTSDATCRIVADSLNYCHEQKGLRVNAFVIMPTHFHAIVFDDDFVQQASRRRSLTFESLRGDR